MAVIKCASEYRLAARRGRGELAAATSGAWLTHFVLSLFVSQGKADVLAGRYVGIHRYRPLMETHAVHCFRAVAGRPAGAQMH
ncbi:hypothetical protein EVAR_98474_1 [Eumeta japonica]|uniref:Uncharacterized protein n=1 Tax=Eumeta variegata TaxID=151549 RepID=A0A4C1YJM7_EUMVA|nr:hypothetical protein EVAR_98474_1 [Eumeta japonica]